MGKKKKTHLQLVEAGVPQDHKKKMKEEEFIKVVNGIEYRLPNAAPFSGQIPAGISMDLMKTPDNKLAQTQMGVYMLELAGSEELKLNVREKLTTSELLELLNDWLSWSQSGGVKLPES